MSELVRAFSPNKVLSRKSEITLITVQAVAFCFLWWFSPFVFLPTPVETASAWSELWFQGLGSELITSFYLNLEAIVFALSISLVLAYSTVVPVFRPIVTFLSKLRFLSLVGLTFFFTLATKNGHELKLYLLVFSMSVFFITSMADVLDSIPKVQFDLARTLRMSEWRVVWEVVVLGQADKVFDVLRQNAAIAWSYLTMVEGMSREGGGIGGMLIDQNRHFHLSSVLAIQGTVLILGLGQDYAIGLMKEFFCPYASLTTERK